MITPEAAMRVGETRIVLPDRERSMTDPVFRPGIARHSTSTVILLQVRALPAQTLAVRAPATSAVRRITDIPPLGAEALTTLLELSPLPFGDDARALFAALQAVPTFYLGVPSATVVDDDLVEIGAELGTVSGDVSAWIGAVFPDGTARVPAAWIESIANALAAVDPANPWPALLGLFAAGERRLMILDHAGRPARETRFQIRLSGDTGPRWVRALPPDVFDLEQVVAADPLDGMASLFAPPAGREFQVRALFGDDAIPVQSILELDATSVGDEFVSIPAAVTGNSARLHLQVMDLGAWYPPASTLSSIERFHRGSRLEPLVDGIPTFKRLVEDLKRAGHPGHGAQFTGWAFNHFVLDKADGRDLVQIARDILNPPSGDPGGDVRLLATKFIQDEDHFDSIQDPLPKILALLILIAGFGTHFYLQLIRLRPNYRPGFILSLFAGLLSELPIALLATRIDEILEFLEPSGELIGPMNALTGAGPIAIHARNPVRFRDNPIGPSPDPLAGLVQLVFDLADNVTDHLGVWHNKSQLVKFKSAPDQTEHAAFLGGIDINFNRLDTPAHNSPDPYHDVHCRLTGPVVRDAWISFNERWEFDRARSGGAPDPIPAPTLADLPERPERHLARVGRTYCGTNPDGNSTPLSFSPRGERSIYDTLLAAIRGARRYIFIEEQYFASEGSVNPPNPGEGSYHAELLNAASECERLVILVPSAADQPWGEQRRRRIFSELREAWGSKLLLGFPQRRPSLGAGPAVAAVGRTRLLDDVGPAQTRFRIGPDVRVPKAPFWMWIDGEVMLIHSTTRLPGESAKDFVTEVDVLRAVAPNDPAHWFSTPRAHKKGAPVTHSRLGSIYVHSKIMIVDDLFVSIGSANLNRRGFFFDGEINAFAIPERLAAAADNPARALRAQLWAQHLGMSPAMGAALLSDPIGDADFLRRSPWLGNRFTPLDAVDLKGQIGVFDNEIASGGDMMLTFLKLTGLASVAGDAEFIWNVASDPTSFADPHPIAEEL
jgi:phosphatidylserine/phosphatidylglycerophosphate/cardiolipin synthase-like enzyme